MGERERPCLALPALGICSLRFHLNSENFTIEGGEIVGEDFGGFSHFLC